MKLLDVIKSKVDNTIKYIFKTSDELIIEMAYINKDDGKNIICVPTQTSCKMMCKFCHITDAADKLFFRNLEPKEISEGINYIYNVLELANNPKVLLISYMGCGEPLLNYVNIVNSMKAIRNEYEHLPLVRFAIATSLPTLAQENFFKLTNCILRNNLLVKIHLSLHYTNDQTRSEWMPNSLPIEPSIVALEYYNKLTKNSVEIHYTLIDGVNDSENDVILLTNLIKNRNLPIKFLFYNEKPTIEFRASSVNKLEIFKKYFDKYGIKFEYYIPPGLDVGASCGQFLMEYYLKYNVR